ncbi:MAG: fatty acid--CoA ligase, partial [Luminiphilus sp.]|nr:fatty acid--CoA ligase [Luminiphilus sp.]
PAEIENQLLQHEDVAQVAVIGMPDERMGEVCAAFVVPTSNSGINDASLIAWSREHMANYKVPRRVIFTDALPLNASGKVLKTTLRTML